MSGTKTKLRESYDHLRFYELLLKKENGSATIKELTELDEIVNRVPAIREKLLSTMPQNEKQRKSSRGFGKCRK